VSCGNQVREHCCHDGEAEEAPVEEWLDIILRPALDLALGDAEPTPTVWVTIRETLEARRQDGSSGE
jgi:hypothetical protein